MRERKHSGAYEVNKDAEDVGWCNVRLMLYMAALTSFIIYIIGSVITGVVYRNYGLKAHCTFSHQTPTTEIYAFSTPLVVVGPCLMSAGGSILALLLCQWCMCRPVLK